MGQCQYGRADRISDCSPSNPQNNAADEIPHNLSFVYSYVS